MLQTIFDVRATASYNELNKNFDGVENYHNWTNAIIFLLIWEFYTMSRTIPKRSRFIFPHFGQKPIDKYVF